MGSFKLMELEMEYVQKELKFRKEILMNKINDALNNRNKEEFTKLSKQYNKLEV